MSTPSYAAFPGFVGRRVIGWVGETGRATIFLGLSVAGVVRPRLRPRDFAEHLHFIGNRSILIILLTSTFTGMVLCLQGYNALRRFGSDVYLGPLVALSLVREIGPVFAALMVVARAGSAMSATIGGMRVTEQIDALEAMAVDPIAFLSSPRLLASLVALPILTTLFDLMGIGSAYLFGAGVLRIDGGAFMSGVRDSVDGADILVGLYKSLVFGLFIAWVACYQGFYAFGGARGIGRAATTTVVTVSVLVLASDYVLTAFLL
jgi:phospholipid/cholesterol/gamma-HCH transport system permease protein